MSLPLPKPGPAKPRGRKAFVRTRIPVVERIIAILIVCLLVGIGVAVWIKGQHYDPALFSPKAESLKATATEVTGKAGTLRTAAGGEPGEAESAAAPASTVAKPAVAPKPAANPETSGEGEPAGETGDAHGYPAPAPAKPAKPVKGEALVMAVPGLTPMSDTEFYSAETLFEKIDGRAGAYAGFNCQGLRVRSFSLTAAKASYVDVYEYRLDTPVNAFGIFALERDPKGKALDFAKDGYSGEMGFFFRQGKYYIQVLASDTAAATMERARAVANDRARAFPVDDTGLDARRKLPNTGLIPESVAFVQENAQGQEFLKNVFQATYAFQGGKLPFFLMAATPADAAANWQKYHDFCVRFGKAEVLPEVKGAKIFQADSFGKTRVIYQREGEIGGIFDATDPALARRFVESLLKGEIQ